MPRSAGSATALATALLVAGCASPTPRTAPPPSPAVQAAQAEVRQRLHAAEALCQQLAADPALAPLRGRLLPPDPGVPWTRAMMVDPGYVDGRDRALLGVMDDKRAHCRQ